MTEAKARTVSFEGVPSNDGDFHWVVDRATFGDVTGREPEKDEQIGRGRYCLYPRDMAALLRGKRRVRVKLTVTLV